MITPPAHGQLEKPHNKQWIYSPFAGYNGEDFLVYRASDGKLQGNLATVRFTINPKNDPPVVEPATFALLEDGKLSIKLIASDPDGDSLTFKVAKAPTFGKLEGKGPTYQYAPERDFNGTDFFIVVPNDGKLDGNATRITLKVNGVNDAPRFESMSRILGNNYRETPLYLPLRATDVDGDKLVFKMAANPKNGVCRLQGDQLVYFPNIGFTGKDEIEIEVSDGSLTDKTAFPLTIGEHPNAIPVHLKEDETNELENAFKRLIYELNARLSRSEDFMLKLETDESPASSEETLADKNSRFLEVNLTADAPKVESLTLDDWIASLKEPNKGHRFTFHAESAGNNEKWLVAPFLDPSSSVDTEVISKGSYGDPEEKKETTGESTDSGQSENDDIDIPNPDSKDSTKIEEEDENPQENEDGEETLPFEESFNTLGELVDENHIPNAQRHEGAQGWYKIDSLGDFYDAGNGWIYQPDLGWCYAVVITEDSSWWLFNENTGWVWCRPDLKNTVFATGTLGKGWIFFPGASLAETETFYSYSTQEWFLWKR